MGTESGKYWVGVSKPPSRWHSGPSTLQLDQPVWYVMPATWPNYEVCGGRYVTMVADHGPERVALLRTTRGQLEVALARLFDRKDEAQREAEILRDFATKQHAEPKLKLEAHRARIK